MSTSTDTQATATAAATPKRRPSRASRGTAKSSTTAPKPKPAAKAIKAAKSTPKAAPKPAKNTGPSERQQRQQVIALLVAQGAKIIETWNPSRHNGITVDVARDAIRQALGYTPAESGWSYDTPHPVLGVRDVGRPKPARKS